MTQGGAQDQITLFPPLPLVPELCLRITKQKQLCSSPEEALETGNYQKGNAREAEKAAEKPVSPPPTLISFQESLFPLSVQSENWNVTACALSLRCCSG